MRAKWKRGGRCKYDKHSSLKSETSDYDNIIAVQSVHSAHSKAENIN